MAYTTIDDPTIFFNTLIWTGNGASSRAISGLGFQPDWSWFKERSGAEDHILFDSVRGATKRIYSNANSAETDSGADRRLLSFDSDGFTVGLDLGINGNTETYVGWNWKAGTSFTNDASSTGIGTIDSTGSVNDTAGFSIISYTGTGSAATVAHGLGSIPQVYFLKNRSSSAGWTSYFEPLGNTKFLQLDTTGAAGTATEAFNNTSPTSSVFSIGTDTSTNNNTDNFIAYVFAEKKGYSKFGSYTGNGNADGTFVYTGFKPAFVIIKPSSYSNSWLILDNKRNTFNPTNTRLEADGNGADYSGLDYTDFLSNGFKIRTSNSHPNNSGGTLIYMAFAKMPFVTSTGIPTTAR